MGHTLVEKIKQQKKIPASRHRGHFMTMLRRESHKKKLRNFGHMSKVGLPYLPSTLVWTKISLDKYSPVYPTYLSRKFGHFGSKVCPLIHISIEYIQVLLVSISSGRSFN